MTESPSAEMVPILCKDPFRFVLYLCYYVNKISHVITECVFVVHP